ncbi:hypothetical protein N7467_009496 [Penicillium canescens]|nr:hypothetical protein N7467_009496 [Penicillium canescens]
MTEDFKSVNGTRHALKQPPKKQPMPLISFVSGATAGGVESVITYPFEYAKTHAQLRTHHGPKNPLLIIQHLVQTRGITSIYAGCSSLAAGTMLKGGVRFFFYDNIKQALSSPSLGMPIFLQGIMAGMAAGAAESVIAVTPSERIKTVLIDDASSGTRKLDGGLQAIRVILREQQLRGLYKGLVPTTVKQSATSAVRMGSYNALKELSQRYEINQNFLTTFLMGAVAGTITVYTTQPFDSIKTRSQGLAGMGVGTALRSIIQDYGIKGLWSGSSMRLGRLLLSGGIVFTVYEKTQGVMEFLFT